MVALLWCCAGLGVFLWSSLWRLYSNNRYLGGTAPNPPGFHYRETVKAGKTFERVWPVKAGQRVFWDMEMKGSYYMDIKAMFNETLLGEARIDEEKGDMFTGEFVADADGEYRVTMYNDGKWHSRTVSYDVRVTSPDGAAAADAAAADGGGGAAAE